MDSEIGEKNQPAGGQGPAGGEEPPRRRSMRRMPDLAALYEAVDQTRGPDHSQLASNAAPEAAAAAVPLPAVPVVPATPVASATPVATPVAPARRRLPDLSLLDELKTPDAPAQPGVSAASAAPAARDRQALFSEDEADTGSLVIPPDLEKFISPDLWRKLNGPVPSRGILVNTLDRVRSTFSLLSTFLPQHLVQEKMRRAVPGLVSGQILSGTLLFSDVSGFTALSERLQALGPQGAEQLTEIMNRYFARMIEIIARSGGTLLKFAGDAMLVYFPEQEHSEQANWAVRAGLRMLAAMSEFAHIEVPAGSVSLKMKIGLASGEYLAASVGSAQRMEYVVLGQAVAQTMTAESLTTAAGQMMVNAQTLPALDATLAVSEHKNGYYRVSRRAGATLDDFEIKAEVRRARGALSWDASPHAILAQAEVALRQINAILPYLSPEVVDRVVVHGQRSLFNSQYRPATVLFCNFWGFESLLASWGSEGVSRVTSLLNAYFSAMNEVVTHFGGIISRIDPYSKGTKMLILFGAPVAHEDDPQRAVSAALAMNAELETINDAWRRKLARHLPAGFSGPLIQHRMGITTGSTFAGQVGSPTRREYTVMGDEVNLSARLMGAADPGQALLSMSAEVQAQVAAYFHLTALAPIRVKGKSKPIAVFQVQGPRDDLLVNRAHSRGPLVGRRAELAKAEALLNQARAGQGALLILQGPAGIGKSHLADTLIQRAEALDVRVLSHQCRSYAASSPYTSWSLLLRGLAGISTTDYQPQVHHQKLQRLIQAYGLGDEMTRPLAMLMGLRPAIANESLFESPNHGEPSLDETGALAEQVRHGMKKRQGSRLDLWDQLESGQSSETGQVWQPILSVLSGRERETVYGALWSLLKALTRQQVGEPLGHEAGAHLIFFEDAHWMDAASLDLLQWLETRIRELPLLILLAQRKSDDAALRRTRAQLITLAPLAAEETNALVANLLIADLAQVIHEQSQGNPLFIEEITRWFKRTHQISAEELRSVLQSSDFLQKLILSRVESLPEGLQEIAMSASVIGSEFRTGEVQALLPDAIDAVTLSNQLRALARTQLIALDEAGADARYSFQQSLVRDVLYNSLPFEQRRALHGKLADYLSRPQTRRRELQAHLAAALEASPSQAALEPNAITAGHYELAERWLEAAQHFSLAGERALPQDPERAAASFTRALANLERIPAGAVSAEAAALKLKLLQAQGDLALQSGAYLAALSAYEAARTSLAGPTNVAEPKLPVGLVYRLALTLPTQRRADEAEGLLRRMVEPLEPLEPAVAVLAALAWLTQRAGRADAQQWIARCATQAGDVSGAWGLGLRALLADLGANWAEARDLYQAAGFPSGAAMMSLLLGQQTLEQGAATLAASGEATALASYQQAEETASQAGAYPCAALACYHQAEVYWRARQADAARSALDRAQAALEKAPSSLAAEGLAVTRSAYKAINLNRFNKWPNWPIQNIVDQYTIKMLSRFITSTSK